MLQAADEHGPTLRDEGGYEEMVFGAAQGAAIPLPQHSHRPQRDEVLPVLEPRLAERR